MTSRLERLADALDTSSRGPWARTVRVAHEAGVVAGVFAIVMASEPSLPPPVHRLLEAAIWTLAALFVAEYAVRLAIAPWAHWAHRDEPWRARAHWTMTFSGLVDLAGVLPLVEWALGVPAATAQLFGAVWILKLAPYAPGLDLLGRVLRQTRNLLLGLLIGFIMVLVIAATCEYVLEGTMQPRTFGTIPKALWWAIATLTTVGYGDAVPVTAGGRMLAGAVMLCGIALCAIWTAILVTGFARELQRSEFLKTWDMVARVPFFHELGAETIAQVAQLLRPSDAATGEVIVRRGHPGECMYFIASGEVEIDVKPEALTLGPGEFFGEMALITGEPRTANAVALTPCELLHLDLAEFRHLQARHPELARRIGLEAERRMRNTQPRAFGPA